ncbi:MAG: OPT/YSL family transporter [Vicinamibacterales bacterium]
MSHPRALHPSVLVPLLGISAAGAVVGVQLLTSLGVTPNTSLVGAVLAMVLGRIPLVGLGVFRSMHAQNLAQSAMSAATFGAANSLLLPIGVPYLFGRPDLVAPMLAGVAGAMFLDAYVLYRLFGSRVFPADGAWPHGVAAAEAIRAGDAGGAAARRLLASLAAGAGGAWLGLPASAFGIACIGNPWALAMFGLGLLASGYASRLAGVDLAGQYVPHGMMIGAGLVALVQVVAQLASRRHGGRAGDRAVPDRHLRTALVLGAWGFVGLAAALALATGLAAAMPVWQVAAFVLYAAAAAFLHELIVGLAAMHSGWFPAFAVALITLLVGVLAGFPPVALAVLTGFSVATGPAFADMGYDLKTGYLLRGRGDDPAFEAEGRRQQFVAATLAFAVALAVVALTWPAYFARDLVPPVARVYVATISAGVAPGVAQSLILWAVPGGLLQLAGGSARQLGVLLSTGLLIANPVAGWGVLAGLATRFVWTRLLSRPSASLEVVAAGVIAGDAVWSFGDAIVRTPRGSA